VDGTLLLVTGILSIFIALVLVLSTIGVITRERQAVGRSLATIQAIEAAPASMRGEIDRPFGERFAEPMLHRLSRWGRSLTPQQKSQHLKERLDHAGNPEGWDADRVIAFKMLALLGFGALGFSLSLLFGTAMLVAVGIGALLAIAGWFTPDLVLYQVAYNRTDRMRKELPDALDLLTISVEAGLAFDAALAQVARNTEGPLADEFFRVLQEMQIGMGRAQALRDLGERTNLPELKGFVTAMVQADAFGIPIAQVLRVQAKEMRVKRSQRAEEIAQKIPVKILFPLIFCIMPVLFVVILGPAAITILRSFGAT
jgi:tight adherence protein C